MKVIVKESGFYGGTWYKAGTSPVEMPEPVARQFLPPYGDQLAVAAAPAAPATPVAQPASTPATKQASKFGGKIGKADA